MNIASLRSSMSSYGDPRYLSAAYPSGAVTGVPSKVLVDGYRGTSDLSNDDRSQYSGSGMISQTNATSVDVTDAVLMHLLTETAIGDSAGYEILPFEVVEDLKREYAILSSRIEGTKRKLALETKLRDAAQSLRRLPGPQPHLNGEHVNGGATGITGELGDEEFTVSSQKCEELAQELWTLEQRAQSVHKRLLEHTAGILQLTHRGLKKNINRNGTSQGVNGSNGIARGSTSEFDDRSLYRSLDNSDGQNGVNSLVINSNALRSTEQKLEQLNGRLRDLLHQGQDGYGVEQLPQRSNEDDAFPAFIQAQLEYLENNIGILQTRELKAGGTGLSSAEMENELSSINNQLHALLGQAGSHLSPTLPPPPSPSGEFVSTHMDYLRSGFDNLQGRIEGLQDQKSILTTQIQQQRELNSKSDAEKDAHVADLTRQLVEARKQFELSEREVQNVRDEMALIMEQLDDARQNQAMRDQGREKETMALETERNARLQAEEEVSRLQNLLREASEAQTNAETEAQRLQEELTTLEGDFARAQTELTVVKAELDGAYGTRAERAAEAAANPALQKQLEDLSAKNISLTEEIAALRAEQTNRDNNNNNNGQGDSQKRVEMLEKELRDTIEDYELMTKASIEFEKEREKYENHIDNLRDRCEQLESQLSDERITWMGINSQMATRDVATETTSTMVLKNEFKKMMRDTRAENMKLLKAEQEERKRLEALVRNLKMENTLGKSNLSQSTVASHA